MPAPCVSAACRLELWLIVIQRLLTQVLWRERRAHHFAFLARQQEVGQARYYNLQYKNVRLRLRSFIVDATVEGSSKMLAVVI